MGSRVIVSRASFMPIFSFPRLSVLNLGSGVTDDDHQCLMPPSSSSHPEISRCKSPRMSVIVLHPHTKFEVRRPSHSKDMADFLVTSLIGLVTLTFLSLNGVTGRPCHGLPSCQFSVSYALVFSTYGQARDS